MADRDALPISVARLRERLGGAVAKAAVPGHVLDADLQALVDENRTALMNEAVANARESARRLDAPLVGEPVTVGWGQRARGVYEAAVPTDRFPVPLAVRYTTDGVRLAYDERPTAPTPYGRYCYGLSGRTVTVSITAANTPDPTALRLVVPTVDEGLAAYADVAKGNAATVDAARLMLERRASEHARLDALPT